MSDNPEARNRSAHSPDQGAMVDERIRAANLTAPDALLHPNIIGGSGTSATTDGSGPPSTGATVTDTTWYKFYATSTVNSGFSTGHVPDGSRVAFTLEETNGEVTPVANSMTLAINGQVLAEGYHYTLSGAVITFTDPPPATAAIYGNCQVAEVTEV